MTHTLSMTSQVRTQQLYEAFSRGAQEVIKQRRELNRINVFPVADGDTGTNMAATMESILTNSHLYPSSKETMQSISDAVTLGSRGNSGAIFAQFTIGFTQHFEDETISETEFVAALQQAVRFVYKALAVPVEGTMITVIRIWAQEVEFLFNESHDLKSSIQKSQAKAYQALLDTPKLLEVLRVHQVLDSGAKGFFHFIEGFISGLFHEDLNEMEEVEESNEVVHDETHIHETLTHRYCTEVVIGNVTLETSELRTRLSELGDSILFIQNGKKIKIHVHTQQPATVVAEMRRYGQVLFQKVDDMARQNQALYLRKSDTALLTDSIADLNQEWMDEHQVHILPMTIIFDQSSYLDRLTMNAERFYQEVDQLAEYPSSSQPNEKQLIDKYSDLLKNYQNILHVCVSSQMSGTYNAALSAARKLDPEGQRIAVLDSKVNSGAEGLLVMEAADLIDQNKSLPEIIKQLTDPAKVSKIFVSVSTLKYMVKMGRISPVLGRIAKWINMKPIVTIDENGKGITMDKAFSKKQTEKHIVDHIKKLMTTHDIDTYSIVHGDDLDRAERFAEVFTQLIGKPPVMIQEVSAIVAMSAGPKTIAIACRATQKEVIA